MQWGKNNPRSVQILEEHGMPWVVFFFSTISFHLVLLSILYRTQWKTSGRERRMVVFCSNNTEISLKEENNSVFRIK